MFGSNGCKIIQPMLIGKTDISKYDSDESVLFTLFISVEIFEKGVQRLMK